jgi:hypothetical protein
MSSKNPQSFAKRARELAVKERRDQKRARKAAAAAERAERGSQPAEATGIEAETDMEGSPGPADTDDVEPAGRDE